MAENGIIGHGHVQWLTQNGAPVDLNRRPQSPNLIRGKNCLLIR